MISDVFFDCAEVVLEYLRDMPAVYPVDDPLTTLIHEALEAMERARIALDNPIDLVPHAPDEPRASLWQAQGDGIDGTIYVMACRAPGFDHWKKVEVYHDDDGNQVWPAEAIGPWTRDDAIRYWAGMLDWYQGLIDHPETNDQDFIPVSITVMADADSDEPKFAVTVEWKKETYE